MMCPMNGIEGLTRGGSRGSILGVSNLFNTGRMNALARMVAKMVSVVLDCCPIRSAMKPCDGLALLTASGVIDSILTVQSRT